MEMPARISLKTRLIPALIFLVLILYIIESYRGWFVLFLALGGALGVSYLWVRSLAKGLKFTRRMRFGWAQVGDRMEEQFELSNDGWAPALWLEVDYYSTMPDYQPKRVSAVGNRGASSQWQIGGVCTRRGVFTLGPVTLRTRDPFGFFELLLKHGATKTVMVTPPIIPLPFIEVAPGGRAGDARPRRFAAEETVSVASVREYHPGDSLRLIHWPTTARRGSYFVRKLDNSPASDWWIFLDMDECTQAGAGANATEEHAVILAASLADRGLRAGHPVGLITHGADLTWLPPRHGEEHHHAVLRALAEVRPGPCSLPRLLELARPAFRQTPSLIVITSNTDPVWVDTLLPLLQRGAVPTVLFLDPESYPPANGSGTTPVRPPTTVVMHLLAELGISRHWLSSSFFDRPEMRPGHQGQWEWRKTASNRAFLVDAPGELAWREVG
ncbi:MAG: DUF58 domain-containing protein [Anaerolineales bacterium]